MKKYLLQILILATTVLVTGCPNRTTAHYPLSQWRQGPLVPEVTRHFAIRHDYRHPLVQKEMRYFLKHKDYLLTLTQNAKPYLYYIYQQTQDRHMPAEIALLPMVESNYNPYSISATGATGLWQMMPGTASGFGIKINWWYDGRRDIKASTTAALNYLAYLHNQFGNWLLAIAAYNSGEGTVKHAIRYNRAHGRPTDYWSLPLPRETKFYIPKLLALTNLLTHAKTYQLTLAPIVHAPYFNEVVMHGQVSIKRVAEFANTDTKTIRQLNPGFRRWATIPNDTYTLLLPTKRVSVYLANLSKNKNDLVSWTHHQVHSGESLTTIARRYHTHSSIIQAANHLNTDLIKPKQSLLVPVAYNQTNNRLPIIRKTSKIISEDRIPGPQRVEHVVAKNDSLSSISKRYHVRPSQIRYWNNLAYHDKLMPKQPLTIWVTHRNRRHQFYTYRVKHGDSLIRIAQRFNTKVSDIQRVNHLHGHLIRIGLELNIPKKQPELEALERTNTREKDA